MAFDKVHQTNILQVLGRLRVPPRMLKLIQRIFSNPIAKFRVLAEGRHSESMTQYSGIGQGCPLSQFLFLFLMSAMFTDIKSRLNTPKQQEPTRGINYRNCVRWWHPYLQQLHKTHEHSTAEIQKGSSYYNMELSLDKCFNLTLSRHQSSIRYMDGTLADTVDHRKNNDEQNFWFNANLRQTQTVLEQSADVIKMENQSILLHHPKQFAIRFEMYSTKPGRKEQTLAYTPYQRRPNGCKRRRENNTTGSTWAKSHWLFWHVGT